MAKFTIHKTSNYTTIDNGIFRDTDMSLKARGLLVTMLSLPPEWDYSVNGLCSIVKDGRDSIRACLVELEELGYLVRERARNEKGQLTTSRYDIYEVKHTKSLENREVEPKTENPTLDNPTLENQLLLSNYYNKISNNHNKDIINNQNNKKNSLTDSVNRATPKQVCVTQEIDCDSAILETAKKTIDSMEIEEDRAVGILRAVKYYLLAYRQYKGEYHPPISKTAMERIVENLNCPVDDLDDLVYDDSYFDLIDRHFKTNYGMYTDYHLQHFVSGEIIKCQAYNTGNA